MAAPSLPRQACSAASFQQTFKDVLERFQKQHPPLRLPQGWGDQALPRSCQKNEPPI